VLLVLFLSALPLAAETLTLDLVPQETTAEFRFGATLHSVKGSLRFEQGTVRFDPETGEASGRIVLDMTSAGTGNARRDRKMHAKILESRRYPQAIFTVERLSGKINRSGHSALQLHGILDLHGTKRPLAISAIAKVDGDRVTAEASFTFRYMEWGMADPSFLLLRVAKEVRVDVKTAGRLQ
jgi:polyisoprenoid-binding protein YceI